MAVDTEMIAFSDFVASLYAVDFDAYDSRPDTAVRNSAAFEEMRRYLIDRNAGMEAVHSFTETDGDIIDCVPVERQPGLAKTRARPLPTPEPPSELQRNAVVPEFETEPSHSPPPQLRPDRRDRYGNQMLCPEGTVPMLRLTLERLVSFPTLTDFLQGGLHVRRDEAGVAHPFGKIWGNAYDSRDNHGGASGINVWSPLVFGVESSASQQWYTSGAHASPFQSVECGYRLGPPFDNKPRLFVFYTTDGYNPGSFFYNDDHLGRWVYASGASHVLGTVLTASRPGAPVQYRMGFFLTGGAWWFSVGGTWVGYYPTTTFGSGMLGTKAAAAGFGGEVGGVGTSFPSMGSGKRPAAGYGHAAYQHDVIIALPTGAESANLTPEPTSVNCYDLEVTNHSGSSWGSYIFFGGPGGTNC
ncbi:neprosin family prolyl endopeptidase [Streptomyces sp. F-7]|uniref:neprosin family prolyl endopeptidase n=1 Tax=Streptomyces sp. F-7 TaxID=573566 RepID=UPI000A837D60|nr:neprosin family prolyl endopeptidase [Streptomyces sp. F-7]